MTVIQALSEFAPILEKIEATSNDLEMRHRLANIRLETPETQKLSGLDPFSEAYGSAVLELYEHLFGHAHNVADEGLDIDIRHELTWGFPYGTQAATTIGGFLIAYGFLIKTLDLPAGARILEIGAGTGGLTYHLTKSGYDVTCLEINDSNVRLIGEMTRWFARPPNIVAVNAMTYSPTVLFDAVVFFETLHHFVNHAELIQRCVSWLKPGGRIAFAAEPIKPEPDAQTPYPWGLRLDGESLRAMHKWGWIELGFTEPYFFELLGRIRLSAQRYRCTESNWADVILGTP